MLNLTELKYREKPIKHRKIEKVGNLNNVTNRKLEKLYDYYICDYCGEEIRVELKGDKRKGGTAIFPHSLTKCGELELALHDKCLNAAIKYFEK